MQLKRNQKRIIVLGIAVLLILYGLLDWIFKFNINSSTVNNATTVLMIVAFILLFSKPKNKNTDHTPTPTDSSIEDTTEETDKTNQIQENASDKNDKNSSTQNTD